jgi:5-dehydro-2-deoxygluconokinase
MKPARLASNCWLALGRAGMDFYADPPGTRVEVARAFTPALGGSAANIAVGIVTLGGSAALLTTLSHDAVGLFAMSELKRYGVETQHVRFVTGEARTSLAVVATCNDDTQSVIYRNGAVDFKLGVDDVRAVAFEDFGGLVVAGTSLALEPSRSATLLAAERARSAGVVVVFDVDYRAYSWASREDAAETCLRYAERSDIVVGNDHEFAVMAGRSGDGLALARALAERCEIVVYKRGAAGSKTFAFGEVFEMGAFPVEPLKPTGAGDAFLSGFATGLAKGLDVKTAVARGSASAAIVVTRVGCAPAMPDETELEVFLARHPLAP